MDADADADADTGEAGETEGRDTGTVLGVREGARGGMSTGGAREGKGRRIQQDGRHTQPA
ncbi:hypothetical protein GCM10010391_58350 [Streptomyces anthocyanicus]|nr:hypothetical protein GCM10010391_58350 [Streptomyces anthocyanicus]